VIMIGFHRSCNTGVAKWNLIVFMVFLDNSETFFLTVYDILEHS
ncbi:1480_t:CDS:2, partial [Dentiscutata heterogama]